MDAQVLVEGHADDRHASSSNVSDQGDGCECTCSVRFVRVDDVLRFSVSLPFEYLEVEIETYLIAGNEYAKDAIPKQH